MSLRVRLAPIVIPVAGAMMLLIALVVGRETPKTEAPLVRKDPPAPRMTLISPSAAPAPLPASEDTLAASMEEARILTTYQNYRIAVATGNMQAQEAIRKALIRDRLIAGRFAERDAQAASSEFDRALAMKLLESLRD